MRLGVEAALVGDKFVPGDVEVVEGVITGYGLPSANGQGSRRRGLPAGR